MNGSSRDTRAGCLRNAAARMSFWRVPFDPTLQRGARAPLRFQIEEREPAFDPRLEGVHSAYPSDEVEVLPRGEVRRRRLDLGHDPDEGLHAQGLPDDVDAEGAGVSRARPELAREGPGGRRL